MRSSALPPPHLQPRRFLVLNAAAGVLFASWVLPATRAWWEALDERVFTALNGTLDANGPSAWNGLWAFVRLAGHPRCPDWSDTSRLVSAARPDDADGARGGG